MTTPLSTLPDTTRAHALNLCLHRLHGRRVASSGVRIPAEGLVLGADSLAGAGLALHYGTLHVAQTHAVVRADAAGWVLEPGCQEMVVVLNDEPIPWGESRPLAPGDRIDMGFASLLVEDALEPECAETSACTVTPSLLEIADIQVVADFSEDPEPQPVKEHTDHTPPWRTAFPDLAKSPLSPGPCDPLAALAAESARALAGKRLWPDSVLPPSLPTAPFPAEPFSGVPLPAHPMPEFPADTFVPERTDDPLTSPPAAASLEEILEGPLTIDDVLDSLKRAHPTTERLAQSDPLAALAVPDPLPDPLLLLAGIDTLPAREPEIAPVLHREHRTTGINSPYRFTVSNDQEAPNEEDPWPHPLR